MSQWSLGGMRAGTGSATYPAFTGAITSFNSTAVLRHPPLLEGIKYRMIERWLPAPGDALDIACGANFSWALALEGYRVAALDRNREALVRARTIREHVRGVDFMEGG